MTTRRRTTWREKLADDKGLPTVIEIAGKLRRRWGTGTCAIPAPREVDALIRQVRRGKVTTINELRAAVARRHGATIGCPMTTGIFAWIAAHAAAEDEAEGRKRITPWWRVLKEGGKLNPKYPGGILEQATRLRAEGHELLPGKGKQPPRVVAWEQRRAELMIAEDLRVTPNHPALTQNPAPDFLEANGAADTPRPSVRTRRKPRHSAKP